MKNKYALFDPRWIALVGKDGLHKGMVILEFYLDSDFPPYYIIKIEHAGHQFLECRDATLMSGVEGVAPPIALLVSTPPWWTHPSRFYVGDESQDDEMSPRLLS